MITGYSCYSCTVVIWFTAVVRCCAPLHTGLRLRTTVTRLPRLLRVVYCHWFGLRCLHGCTRLFCNALHCAHGSVPLPAAMTTLPLPRLPSYLYTCWFMPRVHGFTYHHGSHAVTFAVPLDGFCVAVTVTFCLRTHHAAFSFPGCHVWLRYSDRTFFATFTTALLVTYTISARGRYIYRIVPLGSPRCTCLLGCSPRLCLVGWVWNNGFWLGCTHSAFTFTLPLLHCLPVPTSHYMPFMTPFPFTCFGSLLLRAVTRGRSVLRSYCGCGPRSCTVRCRTTLVWLPFIARCVLVLCHVCPHVRGSTCRSAVCKRLQVLPRCHSFTVTVPVPLALCGLLPARLLPRLRIRLRVVPVLDAAVYYCCYTAVAPATHCTDSTLPPLQFCLITHLPWVHYPRTGYAGLRYVTFCRWDYLRVTPRCYTHTHHWILPFCTHSACHTALLHIAVTSSIQLHTALHLLPTRIPFYATRLNTATPLDSAVCSATRFTILLEFHYPLLTYTYFPGIPTVTTYTGLPFRCSAIAYWINITLPLLTHTLRTFAHTRIAAPACTLPRLPHAPPRGPGYMILP